MGHTKSESTPPTIRDTFNRRKRLPKPNIGIPKNGWPGRDDLTVELWHRDRSYVSAALQAPEEEIVFLVGDKTPFHAAVGNTMMLLAFPDVAIEASSSSHAAMIEELKPEIEVLGKPFLEWTGAPALFLHNQVTREKIEPQLSQDLPYGLNTIRLRSIDVRLVLANYSAVEAPVAQESSEWFGSYVRKQDVGKILRYASELLTRTRRTDGPPTLTTLDSDGYETSAIKFCSWDNLVLSGDVHQMARRDIERFYERRPWFEKHGFPFRRGYLFHGPPGNGKSSSIKTICHQLKMNAYTYRFSDPDASDRDLERMFRDASNNAPAIVLFEDLDRYYPREGEKGTRINLQVLLNCMDGVASADGIVTIATANNPEALDPAILRRPGRFDRAVLFANPNDELRLQYFVQKAAHLTAEELAPIQAATSDMSFAQLQETYIIAGQYAYEADLEDVTVEMLVNAAGALRLNTKKVAKTARGAGLLKGHAL